MSTKLTWNVIYEDFNKREIKTINIFYGGFLEDCKKAYKKHKDDPDAFFKEVQTSLMYYFWSKCEFELVATSLFSRENFKEVKFDVYDQIQLNWNRFCEYLWAHRKELK